MIVKKNRYHAYTYIACMLFVNHVVFAKTTWKKCASTEFEDITHVSSDGENREYVCSHTPDGQIFVSVNGHKIWWNKNADSAKKEPTALISFSAGAVQECNIAYTALSILPEVTIEGTLWGILAPDPVQKPKDKYLYTFEKGDLGYFWQKDETLPYRAEFVSAANDGSVLVLTSEGPYQKVGDEPWKKLVCSTKLVLVAIGNKNALYALTGKHTVLVWKNDTWELLENNKQKDDIRHIAAKNDGTLYCVDKHGKVFYYLEKKGWVALPNIKNAQQIAVSPKKLFCWTSQPYGNAVLKNHVNFVDKKVAALAGGGGVAILGSSVIGAGLVGTGATVVGAELAASIRNIIKTAQTKESSIAFARNELTKASIKKDELIKNISETSKKLTEDVERKKIAMDALKGRGKDEILEKVYSRIYPENIKMQDYIQKTEKSLKSAKFNEGLKKAMLQKTTRETTQAADKAFDTFSAITGNGLVPALLLTGATVVGVGTVPVIIVEGAMAATLFGVGAGIVLMILSRPHNNEIYELDISTEIQEAIQENK